MDKVKRQRRCYTADMAIKKTLEKEPYPMRINKYLALQGHSTRRGADELIKEHRVMINGTLAVLGDKVEEDDEVEVKQSKKKLAAYKYLAFNKPKEVITHSPQKGEKDIASIIPFKDVFPVGRLDKDSHGLIILSNDGRITDRLLNPKHSHEKEYVVRTLHKLRNNFKEKMEAGVKIEDSVTKPCKIRVVNENIFEITLTEGKKHQIKRMCVALFNEVTDLKRIRIMNIQLGNLGSGQYREITGEELQTFLKSLGL